MTMNIFNLIIHRIMIDEYPEVFVLSFKEGCKALEEMNNRIEDELNVDEYSELNIHAQNNKTVMLKDGTIVHFFVEEEELR